MSGANDRYTALWTRGEIAVGEHVTFYLLRNAGRRAA